MKIQKMAVAPDTVGFAACAIYSGITYRTWVSRDGELILGSLPEDQQPDLSQGGTHKNDGVKWELQTLQDFMLDGSVANPQENTDCTDVKVPISELKANETSRRSQINIGPNLPQRIVLIIGATVLLLVLCLTEEHRYGVGSPGWYWQAALTRSGVVAVATVAIYFAVGKRI